MADEPRMIYDLTDCMFENLKSGARPLTKKEVDFAAMAVDLLTRILTDYKKDNQADEPDPSYDAYVFRKAADRLFKAWINHPSRRHELFDQLTVTRMAEAVIMISFMPRIRDKEEADRAA